MTDESLAHRERPTEGDGIFLENTATAERIFGLPETIEFIHAVCRDKAILSSAYVWAEFRRTFIYDTIICHTVFLNSRERGEDLATALKRLPRYEKVRYKPRRLRRTCDVVARLHETPFESLEEAIERLDNDIQYYLERCFFSGLLLPLFDGTRCQMTALNPIEHSQQSEGGYTRFELPSKCTKRERPGCGIASFWAERQADLESVANMQMPNNVRPDVRSELETFRESAQIILRHLVDDPSEAFGERCHVRMADVIICLECPAMVPILTSNRDHYRPLCNATGRPDPISFCP